MYGAACFSGNYASLRQPGSAIPLFHSAIGELDGERGAWRMVKGGMGGLTQAMASFAESKGADIQTDAPVEEILIENGKATGVRLENGKKIFSRCVMANTDPKRTFLKLIDSKHLDTDFAKDINQIRMGHSSPRINLALKGLPDIRFQIVDGSVTYLDGVEVGQDQLFNQSYTYYNDFPVTLPYSSDYLINVLDEDGATDELVSVITFNPLLYSLEEESSVKIVEEDCEITLNLQWVY